MPKMTLLLCTVVVAGLAATLMITGCGGGESSSHCFQTCSVIVMLSLPLQPEVRTSGICGGRAL